MLKEIPRKAIRVELTFEIDVPVEDWVRYCFGEESDPADRDLEIWEYLDAWCEKRNLTEEERKKRGWVRYMNLEVSDGEL